MPQQEAGQTAGDPEASEQVSREPRPEQGQRYPGESGGMEPAPRDRMEAYVGRGLLDGRRALVTGGDSGIGRAVAVAFAKEGADVAISYLDEHEDAQLTAQLVEQAGHRCVRLPGDMSTEDGCRNAVEQATQQLGGLDVLVNNIAFQNPAGGLEEISTEQWLRTFAVNIHSYFWTTKCALPHLKSADGALGGGSVINTASINGLRGNKNLIDYSTTKGAVLAFTYSLAQALVSDGVRVNAVAPGPVWTPLIPATMGGSSAESFGQQVPMGRPAQPDEIAPSYVFFASNLLSGYYSGEVLAPIGGETLPG